MIAKGAPRLVVKERTIAAGEKGYCAACAGAMITKARNDLDALERAAPSSAAAAP